MTMDSRQKAELQERRSDRDLLVRIDERVMQLLERMEMMEKNVMEKPCPLHQEKLRVLERMVWGAYVFLFVQGAGFITAIALYYITRDKTIG